MTSWMGLNCLHLAPTLVPAADPFVVAVAQREKLDLDSGLLDVGPGSDLELGQARLGSVPAAAATAAAGRSGPPAVAVAVGR